MTIPFRPCKKAGAPSRACVSALTVAQPASTPLGRVSNGECGEPCYITTVPFLLIIGCSIHLYRVSGLWSAYHAIRGGVVFAGTGPPAAAIARLHTPPIREEIVFTTETQLFTGEWGQDRGSTHALRKWDPNMQLTVAAVKLAVPTYE